jgi:hypothetical protein
MTIAFGASIVLGLVFLASVVSVEAGISAAVAVSLPCDRRSPGSRPPSWLYLSIHPICHAKIHYQRVARTSLSQAYV